MRYRFREHSGQLPANAENQGGEKNNDNHSRRHRTYGQHRLPAARDQMTQRQRRFKSPLSRNQRERPHGFCLLTRTVCPTSTLAPFATTSSLSLNPAATGMPCGTAGRVATGFSATWPFSTTRTMDRLPCRNTAVAGTTSRSIFSLVTRLTLTVCPGLSQSGGSSGVILTVTMPRD